ncbi:MAG: hypothetical protein K0S43_415 [Cellulosimicrobium sp.]|jgi:hypothetical protein|nr:hypothetical protein [Cellulosimicrobium sp.]
MVDEITWSLSGVDTIRWGLQSVSMWRPPVGVRRRSFEVPGRHGVIPVGLPVFDEPTVSLTMWCHATTQDALEVATMELVALLTAPGLTLGRTSGDVVASAPAQLVSVTPDEFTTGAEATFEVVLAVPGVFLRAEAVTGPDVALATPGGQDVPVAALAAATGPTTDAVLRVTGPATSVAFVDVVSGTGLSWAGALTAGQYLFLDAGALTARRSSSDADWASGGTAVSGALDTPAAGALQLWPRMAAADPAVRAVTVRASGTGWGAGTALAVRAAPAYL